MSQALLVSALALGVTVLDPAIISEVPPRPDRPSSTAAEDSARTREQPPGDPLARYGEYVYVEQLPQPVEKVPPVYPESAREKGISGTVVVQALVGKDGRVKDTRVITSIPELDGYAIAAVKRWRFKPAMSEGRPVAVWVAIPVKFTLR